MQKGVAEFIRLVKLQHNEIMRDATQRVSNSLVRISPVDEGDYVADWDVNIGGWPSDSEQAPDSRKTRTRARLREIIKPVQYGQSVFFENDDPAALALEFGYSKQAPQGVVRLTARRWRGFVRGAAKAATMRIRKMLIDG